MGREEGSMSGEGYNIVHASRSAGGTNQHDLAVLEHFRCVCVAE